MTIPPPNETPEEKELRLKRWNKKLKKQAATLTERELKLCEDEKNHDFMVEYKSQGYNALFNTAMEKDKSLLAISVAGIGFIVAVLDKEGSAAWVQYASYAACLMFLLCIHVVLSIFKLNQELLVCTTTDDDKTSVYIAKQLLSKDKIANWLFYSGILTSTIVGFAPSI
jgi:hypothetical protein